MGAVSFKFDATELNQAIASLSVVSDKLPSEIVNQKSFFIFRDAAEHMQVVEKQTIAVELGAEANSYQLLTKLESGKYSRAKKNLRTFFGQGDGETGDFPLLAAIVQSRASKSGKPSPWAGVSRVVGAQRMADAMQKIYGARQKSRGYFQKGFVNLRYLFKKATRKLATPGASTAPAGRSDHIANGVPAREGARAVATFFVKSTNHDQEDALDKYASPVLQAAFDREASSTAERAAELEYISAIKALGIKVS